jgi:hypothetical protein
MGRKCKVYRRVERDRCEVCKRYLGTEMAWRGRGPGRRDVWVCGRCWSAFPELGRAEGSGPREWPGVGFAG